MTKGAEEILGRKHMIVSMLKLRTDGEITQSDLNEYISNWKIVKDRVDLLREGELVEERLERDGRMVIKYSLSPRGRFIANLLLIIDMTLKNGYRFENSELEKVLEEVCNEFDGHDDS